jgi:Spy/CpxP family protein refolding chaperone
VQLATVLRFARTLPAERKHQIWAAIRSERRALRPYWREIREARAGVREALTAEPFDVNRYRIAHDRLLDAEVKARKAAHSLYENVATLMTAEERRQFADWQATAERQWRARHHRRRPPNPDDDDGDGAAPGDSQVRPAPSAPPIPAKQ